MTDVSSTGSEVVNQAGLARLDSQAASQAQSTSAAIAMTPYEYNVNPGGATGQTAQAAHPSAQRLATNQWQGKTDVVNHAQAAQDRADIWVTVPVDKVETKGGSTTASPVYATPSGYQARPGESAGSIPPAMPAGRPY